MAYAPTRPATAPARAPRNTRIRRVPARIERGRCALIQQLRIYEIFEGNKVAFHARFRDHAMRIMRKYRFEFLALWEARTDRRTEFVYLPGWPDEASKKAASGDFLADPERKEIKRVTNAEHGDRVGEIEDRVPNTTSFSSR